MAITTYAELKSNITDFLNRDDLDTVAPTFISLAESNLSRDIRHWRQESAALRNLTRSTAQYLLTLLRPFGFTLRQASHARLN
jgi:hypothetical protein